MDAHDEMRAANKGDAPQDDVCPDCQRKKAHSANDCRMGYCSKWYAIRDKECEAECLEIKARLATEHSKQLEELNAKLVAAEARAAYLQEQCNLVNNRAIAAEDLVCDFRNEADKFIKYLSADTRYPSSSRKLRNLIAGHKGSVQPQIPEGWCVVPNVLSDELCAQIACKSTLWPESDKAYVPHAFFDAIRRYHAAMLLSVSAAQPEQAKKQQIPEGMAEWELCTVLSQNDDVDEALSNLVENATGDNAVCAVRAVVRALRGVEPVDNGAMEVWNQERQGLQDLLDEQSKKLQGFLTVPIAAIQHSTLEQVCADVLATQQTTKQS